MTLRIANGAGFWGDWLDAPRQIVERAEVDYLTLEYLAELTMSILAQQRRNDPQRGYATDFLDVLRSITPALAAQPKLKIITNAGGMNPIACARATGKLLAECGLGDAPIGLVSGDDITDSIPEFSQQHPLANLDTGQRLRDAGLTVVSANAYLGAAGIVEALAGGARIVITGRVADASLTVGPAVHHFGWAWDDWDRLAGGTVAGHLIECGAQVTGGYSTEWQTVPNLANVGYPIAEVEADGSCVITKPPGTGGEVNRRTVVEQLVYEIGDPRSYITPDVVADFTSVKVEELGNDRVAVNSARGKPATDSYKVSLAYEDGYTASALLFAAGKDCGEKAARCGNIILERLQNIGQRPSRVDEEFWGLSASPERIVFRIAVADHDRAKVERFTREIAPLITSGPAGLAGYAAGRSPVRPVLAYWPTLATKSFIHAVVDVKPASEWVLSTEY
jgi:hypothetical protein